MSETASGGPEPLAPQSLRPAGGITQAYVRAGLIQPGEGIRATGAAAAAILAAGLGILALGGSGVFAAIAPPFDRALVDAGRLFVPGGAHLGRLGGQQVLALVAWLGSWALLHWRWRFRQVSLTATAAALVLCLVLATLFLWPPITRALVPLAR